MCVCVCVCLCVHVCVCVDVRQSILITEELETSFSWFGQMRPGTVLSLIVSPFRRQCTINVLIMGKLNRGANEIKGAIHVGL